MLNTYIYKPSQFMFLFKAKSANQLFINLTTTNLIPDMGNSYLSRQELINRGYRYMYPIEGIKNFSNNNVLFRITKNKI